MTDYSELVKALQWCAKPIPCSKTECPRKNTDKDCACHILQDSAAAIEALRAEVKFYKNLSEEWQEAAERKERLLGTYRAQNIYSAKDSSGYVITNLCSLNCSEIPNS